VGRHLKTDWASRPFRRSGAHISNAKRFARHGLTPFPGRVIHVRLRDGGRPTEESRRKLTGCAGRYRWHKFKFVLLDPERDAHAKTGLLKTLKQSDPVLLVFRRVQVKEQFQDKLEEENGKMPNQSRDINRAKVGLNI